MSDNSTDADRRTAERRPLHTQASVLLSAGRALGVRVVDVSMGGMAIASPSNPPQGTTFTIRFSMPKRPSGSVIIQERVEVMHSVFSGDVGAFKVGLRFLDLSAPAAEALVNYIRRV